MSGSYRQLFRSALESYRPRYRHELHTDWISALFYRPLSLLLTPLAVWLGVSPTAVTLAGLAVACCLPAFALTLSIDLALLLIGLGGIVFCVFDCLDGNVARVSGRSSWRGGCIDFQCDLVYRALLYLALGLLVDRHAGDLPVSAALLGLIAALLALLARLARLFDEVQRPRDPGAPVALPGVAWAFVIGIDRTTPLLALAAYPIGGVPALLGLIGWLLLYSLGDFISAQVEVLAERKNDHGQS
jgi:phosphatidylglycerophosphate synthase